ncbi:MAG TPA: hypothetical protein VIA07_02155 [Desulfuromonadales bacterium]|jgi:hypothetical protein
MNDHPKSKGEMVIERIMQELDPASPRYQVLATARRFKSSWVELGEKLLQIQKQGQFREWGYDSFEDYCSREIRIKKPTAQKLTLAYRYLEKDEPELLVRQTELKPLPDYRSVELLRQAREEKAFSEEEYAGLRRAVIDEERSHPTILKRFKEVAATRSDEPPDTTIPLKSALAAARRLQTVLRPLADLPLEHLEELARLIACLEEMAEAGEGGE